MNPIVKMVNSFKTYRLTKQDLERARGVRLNVGAAEWNQTAMLHEVCIMQLVAMLTVQHEVDAYAEYKKARAYDQWEAGWEAGEELTGEVPEPPTANGFTDEPVCVSEAVTSFLISINDTVTYLERERLIEVVADIVNTCPVRMKEYKTKPTVEVRVLTPQYRAAERKRKEILREAEDKWYYDHDMDALITTVREAANLFRVAPALEDEEHSVA